jgi:enoyl-[acyl-carrier protein] reductase II
MRTRLTELLKIDHPVMLAGMGGVSYHQVVAAVSEAGGFGCLGASTMGHEEMVGEIEKVRGLTDKPFGVDLLTAAPQDLQAKVQDIIDGGASVFVAGLGIPAEVVAQCHEQDVIVINMCGKVSHAVRAVEAGCDVVVAQGTEAGGHTGQVATMALVPQVVDAVGAQAVRHVTTWNECHAMIADDAGVTRRDAVFDDFASFAEAYSCTFAAGRN